MLGWMRPPLFDYRTPIDRADAEEAKALKRFHKTRAQNREWNELIATAARVADSVGRLSQELRSPR